MRVRGGQNVYPADVESVLARHPAIAEAVALGTPDAVMGERICLYAVGGRLDLARLRAAMRTAGVATFKLPERLVLADSLPVTAVGKIDKKALRADIAGRIAAERMAQNAPNSVAAAG